MTNEERDLIARFIGRVGGAQQASGFSGSVPQAQPALPPIDSEADAFINQQFQQHPEARYRITQMAVVQEAALAEMNNRVQRLQWELQQARQALQSQPQQGSQPRGFFSSLFGGGSPQQQRPGGPWGNQGYPGGQYQPTSPPPQPQYPPQYQPGMFQQRGSGFLGSALTTAAGVAGGLVVGNALMNAFSGHHAEAAGLLGGGTDTSGAFDNSGVVPAADPSAGFGGQDYGAGASSGFDQGGGFSQGFDQGGFDQGGLNQGGFDQGGFDQAGGFDSGGFDSGSDNT
jgi:hypothetical protein